jgi:phosphoribosylformimino-5-aminoimidazole carboxamide ribotide isomerase
VYRFRKPSNKEMMDKLNQRTFIVYPAIDLRNGKVVRLSQGDPERQTTYSQDPSKVAARWLAAEADWLHIVNLDGAFGETSKANRKALKSILATLQAEKPGAKLQLGGGLRDLSAIRQALELGAARVILGTSAVENPALVSQALASYGPDRIGVGIDVRAGQVAIRGWQEATHVGALDLARELARVKVKTIVYTDISRDGMRTGADLKGAAALAKATGLNVIAAGGVHTLPELHQAKSLGLAGAVIGRALYEGQIDLRAALRELA